MDHSKEATMRVLEEQELQKVSGGFFRATLAVGEEQGGATPTTRAIGEEVGGLKRTTLAIGEGLKPLDLRLHSAARN
jgi:hypothetical protein